MGAKIRAWIYQFMQGRYGFDEFGRFLGMITLVCFAISLLSSLLGFLLPGGFFAIINTASAWIGVAILIYLYFRVFSRNHGKRMAENAQFLSRMGNAKRNQEKRQDKEHTYMHCEGCGVELRVPKNVGTIMVNCPKCGHKTKFKS